MSDPWNEMWVTGHLCEALLAEGATAEAMSALQQAQQAMLGLSRAVGDQRGEANALWYSARAAEAKNEIAVAEAKNALAIYRVIDDPRAALVELWLRKRDV